ncbi:hypothetical protein Tco_1336564 [Tanacetum coccineum]
MSSPKFAETHNVAAFLEKPKESDRFAEIIDFLKASSIYYALTVNPIIYTSCIEQFWATAMVQTVNGVRQLQALVDKKRVIVTESSIRKDLHLDDAEGTDCLLTATIFEELARMGAKSTTWNEFSSSTASLIICLATNQKFNLSKYIFDSMVKHLDGGVKLLMYPHIMVQASEEVGEDSCHPTDSTQVPILDQPSTSSKPKKKQPSKKTLRQEAESESSEDQESLVAPEDASKQGGSIEDIDTNVEVTLVDETQERQDDELMFDSRVLDADEMLVEVKVDEEDEQCLLLQLLTNNNNYNKTQAKGVVVHEPSEFRVPQETQSKEREELTDEEKGKLFMELMEKRRKHFAALRAQEKRNRPPSKAQKRTQMSTYLKHMGRYTYKQLKGKSFDEIQKLFDKEIKRVNTFVAMGYEVQESKEKKVEGSE